MCNLIAPFCWGFLVKHNLTCLLLSSFSPVAAQVGAFYDGAVLVSSNRTFIEASNQAPSGPSQTIQIDSEEECKEKCVASGSECTAYAADIDNGLCTTYSNWTIVRTLQGFNSHVKPATFVMYAADLPGEGMQPQFGGEHFDAWFDRPACLSFVFCF